MTRYKWIDDRVDIASPSVASPGGEEIAASQDLTDSNGRGRTHVFVQAAGANSGRVVFAHTNDVTVAKLDGVTLQAGQSKYVPCGPGDQLFALATAASQAISWRNAILTP